MGAENEVFVKRLITLSEIKKGVEAGSSSIETLDTYKRVFLDELNVHLHLTDIGRFALGCLAIASPDQPVSTEGLVEHVLKSFNGVNGDCNRAETGINRGIRFLNGRFRRLPETIGLRIYHVGNSQEDGEGWYLGPQRVGLQSRESEIMNLVASDLPEKEIAAQLVIAPGTVQSYLTEVYRKLGVNSGPGAVLHLVRAGLIDPKVIAGGMNLNGFDNLLEEQHSMLRLLISGHEETNEQVANNLGILASAVQSHLSNIGKLVGAKGRIGVAIGYREWWLGQKAST